MRRYDLLTWLGSHELALLLILVAAAGGLWGFVELADMVFEGETYTTDARLLLLMRNPADRADPVGPPWIEEIARDFTALGGTGVLTLVTLATAGFLLLRRKYRVLLLIVAAVVGGILLSTLLKEAFARPRPDVVPHESVVYTASFPSGHSMMSAVTYLTLGALLARVQPRRRVKAYLLLLAVLLTFLVGVSRVYLGVHWPTDVLAGWTAGAVWALLCWATARWLQLRRRIESDLETGSDDGLGR